MNFSQATRLLVVCFVLSSNVCAKKPNLSFEEDDVKGSIGGKFNTTTVFDVGSLLNKEAYDVDKSLATKTTINLQGSLETSQAKMYTDIKSSALWGNNRQLKTAKATIKNINAVSLEHDHLIIERMIWVKEAWLELKLTDIFSLNLPGHTFKIGSFPFAVGRGIALGSAYSVSPTALGFYSDKSVDQYAFGAKISGTAKKDFLTYDLYAAVLENNNTSAAETAAQTQVQSFNGKSFPYRGFGAINWIVSGRMQCVPLKGENKELKFEPYVVYNDAPEQKVEFVADANSKLTTFGMAVNLEWDRIEISCEGAFNKGRQQVKGWDRNKIEQINRDGVLTFVYSDVYTEVPTSATAVKVVYDPSSDAAIKARNTAVNNVTPSSSSNSVAIAGTTFFNGASRFRDAYSNKYSGFMAVGDIGFWLYKKDFKIAAAAGIASGDRNPNVNLADPNEPNIDGDYAGFLGLQEIYRGTQVKSAYVMSGKLKRLLSAPNTGDQFAALTSGFNNIIYAGFSGKYAPKNWTQKISIHPNVLGYWQHAATTKFDKSTGLSSTDLADKFLGTEFNVLSSYQLSKDVEIGLKGAVFVPGKHYKDIEGKPFTAAQQKALRAANSTSQSGILPVLGTDPGYTVACELTYAF